ncbi:SET domain-containing protein-lysine N-methyltransferase [Sansalvadorimonas sp. 2012CJ34-2]|uniref:SET domain-containing protein-lysine N-methyltransferase n=1 Tax=Parendozoicomonas callyspongiae TaxID=2942213 RepID=A0ABT0PKX9_9GAMM|nr:SET domain-containing protein-lysine N-methyltransferase [Sansalvadorimonas sp. 2012CJ34-2]MCL6272024.1 SET domain-containing protein-lysine N-methyltransferase [Sansalvadorimonas sp. 2012CJ34-2]
MKRLAFNGYDHSYSRSSSDPRRPQGANHAGSDYQPSYFGYSQSSQIGHGYHGQFHVSRMPELLRSCHERRVVHSPQARYIQSQVFNEQHEICKPAPVADSSSVPLGESIKAADSNSGFQNKAPGPELPFESPKLIVMTIDDSPEAEVDKRHSSSNKDLKKTCNKRLQKWKESFKEKYSKIRSDSKIMKDKLKKADLKIKKLNKKLEGSAETNKRHRKTHKVLELKIYDLKKDLYEKRDQILHLEQALSDKDKQVSDLEKKITKRKESDKISEQVKKNKWIEQSLHTQIFAIKQQGACSVVDSASSISTKQIFEVKQSDIEGAGQGLFAKKFIPSCTCLGEYYGEQVFRMILSDGRYIIWREGEAGDEFVSDDTYVFWLWGDEAMRKIGYSDSLRNELRLSKVYKGIDAAREAGHAAPTPLAMANHSKNPNVNYLICNDDKPMFFATKDINVGDEITWDYDDTEDHIDFDYKKTRIVKKPDDYVKIVDGCVVPRKKPGL